MLYLLNNVFSFFSGILHSRPPGAEPETSVKIRDATIADLDSVVGVVLSAMPLDPQWNYRFPYRDQFLDDHVKFTKLLFQYFIQESYDDWHVMVGEAASADDATVTKIVAFAVWDVSYVNKRKHGTTYIPQNPMLDVSEAGGAMREDANSERLNAFTNAGIKAKQDFLNDVYGDNQIHLQILGTHPDAMRRGFGSALCAWGMAKAREDGLVVSLLAGPKGYPLYTHLNFQALETVVVQVPDDEDNVFLTPMVFQPENDGGKLEP